jgi:hypothetical protein
MGKHYTTRKGAKAATTHLGFVDKPEISKPSKESKAKATKAKKASSEVKVEKPEIKKAPKAAKVTKSESLKNTVSGRTLDLCLICDCTGSMYSWIQRAKDTLHSIIDSVKIGNTGLKVRVAFVGYRDIGDGKKRFSVINFTEDVDSVKAFISKQDADGGQDHAEDVQGAFNQALNECTWMKGSIKSCFHIADAPGHGKDICSWGDDYPSGSPDGFKI